MLRLAQARGVVVRPNTRAEDVERDVLVIACGPWSPELAATVGVDLPIRPLCRQLLETSPVAELPDELPMVIEAETGFHFRRRGDAARARDDRPGAALDVRDHGRRVGRSPTGSSGSRARYPPAADATIANAWAGLYDMTPDAHPIVGRIADGVYAACGFSGHGFMQSPAVGRALAELILRGESSLDLSPYALERFDAGAMFPEHVVL